MNIALFSNYYFISCLFAREHKKKKADPFPTDVDVTKSEFNLLSVFQFFSHLLSSITNRGGV